MAAAGLSSCGKNKVSESRKKEVVVYTYDSFVNEWGPGDAIIQAFEEEHDLKLTLVNIGDGANIVARAVAEKKRPVADMILGVDNHLASMAYRADILVPYRPESYGDIHPEIIMDDEWRLVPYDYSYFAIVWDSQSGIRPPKSLEDLASPEYEKKLILMSPKTSTPGLGFALWTAAVFGENYADYWKRLSPSILTMASSWSTGYGLFTQGEAPLVCSYTTSPAYHLEYENTERYKALIFDDGHLLQIECAGILKSAPNIEGAKTFIDFLVSMECQEILPLTQWMYPANSKVALPDCYRAAPKSEKPLTVPETVSVEEVQSSTF